MRQEDREGEPRFTMLETIREYAVEKLRGSVDWGDAHDRHAAYFLSLAQTAEPELMGHGQLVWLERLETEHDNLRAAMSHLLAQHEIERAVLLAKALLFWWLHAHVEEGIDWTERIVADSRSVPAFVQALALAEAGVMAFGHADPGRAQPFLEQSMSLLQESGHERQMVVPITILGQLATERGDYARATELLEDGLDRSRKSGQDWYAAIQLDFLGQIPLRQADYDAAAQRFEEALDLSRQVGDRFLVLFSLSNLARAREARGDPSAVKGLLQEGLSLAAAVGDDVSIAHYLEGLAALAERRNDTERAGRLHGAAEALRTSWAGVGWLQAIGSPASELSPAPPTGETKAAFERASAQGAAMDRQGAIEYALGDEG